MSRTPVALMNLAALRHNYALAKTMAGSAKTMAVIKANAYGHGLVRVARALNDADAFALSCYQEAVAVRSAGVRKPLVLLEGFHASSELLECTDSDIEWVIHHRWQIDLLCSSHVNAPVTVWLKIDTGMGRLGFKPHEIAEQVERLQSQGETIRLAGYMTHLANADCPEDKTTSLQLEKFEQATFGYAGLRSAANSAGLCAWETSHYDWVRPGIMLYGVSPFETKTGAELGLKSVMTLKSRLISIKSMQQGDSISYGGTWVCPESMSVGVVAIGYGDGYPRHAVSGTPVLIRGKQVPLVGRVTMDMICVDLRGLPEAEIGDEVVLWGAALPVEIIAQKSGTIAYELLCQVTSRVRQVVEHGEE